jgi:hypothetical protein
MYLSHPVRRMRDDPGEGTVALVVELDATDAEESLREVVDDVGGSVETALGFDCWQVRVPETALEALCTLDEVVRIETTATLELGIDDDSTKGGSTDS